MNKRGQEISPGGALMGIVGAVIAIWYSGLMGAGIIMRIVSTLVTGAVCYFMAAKILESG